MAQADYPNNETWKENIQDYEYHKKHIMWEYNHKPQIITHQHINEKDYLFNPISQLYYDDYYNQYLRSKESKEIKNAIAHNYDNTLRNVQTYDIINLKDKLQGLENHPDYPQIKRESGFVKNFEPSRENYNIISNISLDKHNFLPPEMRPTQEEPNPIKPQKVHSVIFKDYDIITNRVNPEEKEITTKQIEKLNAAQKYWKSRDYNYIKGAFYDPEKEKDYQRERSEKEKNLRKYYRKDELMFNPVNNLIIDECHLDKYDKNQGDKKKRYKIRYEVENYYRINDYHKDKRLEKSLNRKFDYRRYKNAENRGYDIVNFTNIYDHYKNSANAQYDKEGWDEIVAKSGNNETITKKGIYKDPYDTSDADKNEYIYNIKRNDLLRKLPDMKDEDLFKRKSHNMKLRDMKVVNISPKRELILCKSAVFCDKATWFNEKKNVELPANKALSVSKDRYKRIIIN